MVIRIISTAEEREARAIRAAEAVQASVIAHESFAKEQALSAKRVAKARQKERKLQQKQKQKGQRKVQRKQKRKVLQQKPSPTAPQPPAPAPTTIPQPYNGRVLSLKQQGLRPEYSAHPTAAAEAARTLRRKQNAKAAYRIAQHTIRQRMLQQVEQDEHRVALRREQARAMELRDLMLEQASEMYPESNLPGGVTYTHTDDEPRNNGITPQGELADPQLWQEHIQNVDPRSYTPYTQPQRLGFVSWPAALKGDE